MNWEIMFIIICPCIYLQFRNEIFYFFLRCTILCCSVAFMDLKNCNSFVQSFFWSKDGNGWFFGILTVNAITIPLVKLLFKFLIVQIKIKEVVLSASLNFLSVRVCVPIFWITFCPVCIFLRINHFYVSFRCFIIW